MDLAINKKFMAKLENKFYAFLLYWLNSATKNTSCQTFAVSYMCSFFGLSRSGINLLGELGFGLKENNYDLNLKLARQRARDAIR